MTWEIIWGDCLDYSRCASVVYSEPYHRVETSVIPDKSVHCVVTSPPYWALRDYGVAGQLGLESTPKEYITNMVDVFREVRRVLRDDGVCFVNLGDSFSGLDLVGIPWRVAIALQADGWILRRDIVWSKSNPMPESVNGVRWVRCRVKIESLRPGNNRGVGERLEDTPTRVGNNPSTIWKDCPGCAKCDPHGGYVLRKGSGRCSTAHEYLFQLVKTGVYYYDCEAVKEPLESDPKTWGRHSKKDPGLQALNPRPMFGPGRGDRDGTEWGNGATRNKRSVWEIATQSYEFAHFATFPEKLVEPCIKAGTSQKGCCPDCGSPWARVLDDSDEAKARLGKGWHDHTDDMGLGQRGAPPALKGPAKITLFWAPTCDCIYRTGHDGKRVVPSPVPCVVYDPFCGSGTTGVVAVRHGRDFIGHELSGEYIPLSEKRIRDAAEKAGKITVDTAGIPSGKPTQLGLFKK